MRSFYTVGASACKGFRAGIHTGECEVIDVKVGGLAVSIGARVASNAGPSEVARVADGAGPRRRLRSRLRRRGASTLKFVPDRWHLYRVVN